MQLGIIRRPINQASAWLLNHRADVTSQWGEDGIIAKIFEIIGQHGSVCVEFGAWDGKRFSNTFALVNNGNWTGYLIEANTEKFKVLQDTYRNNPRARTINRFVKLDAGEGTLDEILAENNCPADIDLVSIDIDGNDFYVWESIVRNPAKVVVIEFNPTVPNDVIFIQERSFAINQGCSLLALTYLARKKGYQLVSVTKTNAIFVRSEYFPMFNIVDNSPDAMYQPLLDGRIFQGYDGTIHVTGMPRLLWRNMELTPDLFQVLPPEQRTFGDAQR